MYTVGLKRRWWFGFKEYEVKAHSWDGDRLILNVGDGSQIYVPGLRSVAVKVYPNFWIHLHSLPKQEPVQPPVVQRAGAVAAPIVAEQVDQDDYVAPIPDHVSPEVRKIAAERVRGILQESGFTERSARV